MNTLIDENERFVIISARIEDVSLTTEAFRVYFHLMYRRNSLTAKCMPSYKTIGECCFRGSYPESPVDTLRKKAIAAVKELINWGLIIRHHVTNDIGRNVSNRYILTKSEKWFDSNEERPQLAHKAQPVRGIKKQTISWNDSKGSSPATTEGVIPEDHLASHPGRPSWSSPATVTNTKNQLDEVNEKEKKIKNKKKGEKNQGSPEQRTESSRYEKSSDSTAKNLQTSVEDLSAIAGKNEVETSMSRIEQYEAMYDRTGKLPLFEMKAWARLYFGDLVKLYRKSGTILSTSSMNDVDRGFKEFLARKITKGQEGYLDKAYADNMLRSFEADPRRWSALSEYVKEWAASSAEGKAEVEDNKKQINFQQLDKQDKSWHKTQKIIYDKNPEEFANGEKSAAWQKYWYDYAVEKYPDLFV